MATLSEALQTAVQHHRAGRWQVAWEIYQRILAVDPNQADALHLAGAIATQLGRHAVAEEHLRRAVAVAPAVAQYQNSLAICLKTQGKLDEAGAVYRRALELKPDYAEAASNLGNLLHVQGHGQEAEAWFARAIEWKPDFTEAHNGLGLVRQSQGRLDEATAAYREALRLRPDYAEAEFNLASALRAQDQVDGAIAAYQRGLALRPDLPEPLNNLANALEARGRTSEALACYERALSLAPEYAEAHYNLANALKGQGRLGDAVREYQRVLELKPDLAEAHNNLGNALKAQGKLDEAIASFGDALRHKPGHAGARSNRILTLQYRPGVTLAALADACAEFERQHAIGLRPARQTYANLPLADRPLRLGFVSPDFGRHPVGFFLIRALENLDPTQTECVCYCDRVEGDDLTARFQAASLWRRTAAWSDGQLAEQIRADRIDILFDLAGHTAHNRLLMFARKPAPVQISWLGYVGTTGLSAVDYLLADRYTVPPEAEYYYRERILRMPDSYVCYDPPGAAPPVGPLPALSAGRVTFGCFNNPAKISRELIAIWARILRRVPTSRLVLKYLGFDDPSVSSRYLAMFAEEGVEPERIELAGWSAYKAFLPSYHRVDLALDPWPHGGGLTTCEALWMGVPVISRAGETFAGRQSLGHLSTVGLQQTIARDADDYVEIAVRLALDLRRLDALRAGLRDQVARSPLCDGGRFADNLTRLLREVWGRWCAGLRESAERKTFD